jgi:hypothetical protein
MYWNFVVIDGVIKNQLEIILIWRRFFVFGGLVRYANWNGSDWVMSPNSVVCILAFRKADTVAL